MSVVYYFKNLIFGVFCLFVVGWNWYLHPESEKLQVLFALAMISCLLYPVAKKTTECIALKFTNRSFWHKGLLKDDIGKNGLYAIYWVFCFVFAIPLSLMSPFILRKTA
ncbi:colicin E1 family microcin immunity protein [Pantoea ananatis]|uniref:colicin E1 family microcin immunity protein n=1 Tax=Pantoea ananas TaxID=553 RepID=UPI000371A92C|nr:colicin E1 family microcin immunity protein [Pantoea ananatis]